MAIGSLSDLFNSSQGKMVPRVMTPPKAPADVDFGTALARRNNSTMTQALGPSTNIYNKVVSSPATGGLTDKGKYGGFYSASDQQSAIEGSAINLRENVAPALLAKAQAFYNKLDPMYGQASLGAQQWTRKDMGYNPQSSSAATFRQFEETSQNRTAPLRSYAKSLNDWYATQSKPAEAYNASAMQIQSTPLSQLASQIATTGYGMNPDLATAKFSGLDTQYFKQQQDQASMAADMAAAQQLGIPASSYKAYKATEAENAKTTAAQPKLYQNALETATNFKASTLESATGQTSQQLYQYLAPTYTLKDPDTNSTVNWNGSAVVDRMSKYISSGDTKAAKSMIDGLTADPTEGYQDLVRILTAMYKIGMGNPTKSKDATNYILGQ